MRDQNERQPDISVNPGYASFQLAKALTTETSHPDAATRERARVKIAKWMNVLKGLFNGQIAVGSRTPISNIPAWATPEVVTGGFATGRLLAGGELLPHERHTLAQLAPGAPESEARRILNSYFLSDQGLAELRAALTTRRYHITVPEEGLLPVVAWFVERGQIDEARGLIDAVTPYFSTLRFYPTPIAEAAPDNGPRVFLQDVATTIEALERVEPNSAISAQQEAVRVWAPLYDQMVALFLETVVGTPPTLARDSDVERIDGGTGVFPVVGGWPCQAYPPGWRDRAIALLERLDAAAERHQLCGRPDRPRHAFAQLRDLLRRCVDDPTRLTGREVGRVRLILARSLYKRGLPDSEQCSAARLQQAEDVSAPLYSQIAALLIERLKGLPASKGIDDTEDVIRDVSADESARKAIPAATPIPPPLRRKVDRCRRDTPEELTRRGLITSGESLARVLPQVTAGLRAADFPDATLRDLYASIYRAFSRRRSLLLLNLQSQVRIEELPWVKSIESFRAATPSASEASRATLRKMAFLTLRSFPHAIVPNKLVQEFRSLAKTAALHVPIIEEIAADIFMGQFSARFVESANVAGDLLHGTLYERYYSIDYRLIRSMPARTDNDAFAQYCRERAGAASTQHSVAANGMIIEQQQIVTTQNLAPLLVRLDLRDTLQEHLHEMSRQCFEWICRRLQMKLTRPRASLKSIKNAAYAWRQMIFFLSLLSSHQAQEFVAWTEERLEQTRPPFRTQFLPAIRGLAVAASGQSLDEALLQRAGARRFTGWSATAHWLMPTRQ